MGKTYLFEKIINKNSGVEEDEEASEGDEESEVEQSDQENSFDADSDLDSDDAELQRSFATGELQPGLHALLPYKRTETLVNDQAGLKQKLEDLMIYKGSWLERLDLVNEPAPVTPELIAQYGNLELKMNRKGEVSGEEAADSQHDFKREMLFYRQAQASSVEGLRKLQHQFGITKTRRPDDYFAEMIKSDQQMKKVRERLQTKQNSVEASEKARKLRELKKYGKKVQQEVTLKRQKEKKEMLDKIKSYKKGKEDNLDFLDKDGGKNKNQQQGNAKGNQMKSTKKQKYKEARYGYGGQKKRSKYNTSDSAADMSGYSARKNGRPRAGGNRPGKSRRANMRSKK